MRRGAARIANEIIGPVAFCSGEIKWGQSTSEDDVLLRHVFESEAEGQGGKSRETAARLLQTLAWRRFAPGVYWLAKHQGFKNQSISHIVEPGIVHVHFGKCQTEDIRSPLRIDSEQKRSRRSARCSEIYRLA